MQARVNIPALSERTMRRHIVDSDFSNSWNIRVKSCGTFPHHSYFYFQLATLDHASKVHPKTMWWIKADGCDIVSGLKESLNVEWNGDADYGTTVVQNLYDLYRARLNSLDCLSLEKPIIDRWQAVTVSLKQEYTTLGEDVKVNVCLLYT